MIYNGYLIQARVETWDSYEVNEDGSLGDYIGEGGGDTEYPLYDVWTLDEDGDSEECLDDTLNSVTEAKVFIDELIKRDTTFQSEAGN